MEQFKGYIERFVFESETDNYKVMELVTDNASIICFGQMAGYGLGESVEVTGEFVIHPVYNKQLKISSIKTLPLEDKIAVQRYLGSGAIKGIGETIAKRIVKLFGDDTFRIIEEEPERLAEVKGISLKMAYNIGNQLAEKRDLRDAMIFLQQYNISQNLANKIYEKYGYGIYQIMRENPYKLAEDISGVGFKIADDIARKGGINIDSEYRINCGVVHVMTQTTLEGHCYYPYDQLIEDSIILLETAKENIEHQIEDLRVMKKLVITEEGAEKRVYLPQYYFSEYDISKKLWDIQNVYLRTAPRYEEERILDDIAQVEAHEKITLDVLQKKAVYECMNNGVFVLSGGPGTGKTTTINTVLNLFERYDIEFYLAAPTGRAAKRMEETTGYEAKTIHRLLEVNGEPSEDRRTTFFDRNEENPLECDAIIVDEMSMVDIHLFRALLRGISLGTKLILIGDANQLPSVGPGQVLADILGSGIYKNVRLEKIFRQDEGSHIVSNAYKINAGELIDLSEKNRDFFFLDKRDAQTVYTYIMELAEKHVPKEFKIKPYDVQILTPMKMSDLGTIQLNKVLQQRLNPPAPSKLEWSSSDVLFREGDKVMQVKNDYNLEWEIVGKYDIVVDRGTGVYNGDIGIIKSINMASRTMLILFDDNHQVWYPFENLDQLELAYAMTIHKSQGSEYPVVIMPLLNGPSRLFARNLLYTGVTRAKHCCILIGSSDAIARMIRNNEVQKRYTSLPERLIEIADDQEEGH